MPDFLGGGNSLIFGWSVAEAQAYSAAAAVCAAIAAILVPFLLHFLRNWRDRQHFIKVRHGVIRSLHAEVEMLKTFSDQMPDVAKNAVMISHQNNVPPDFSMVYLFPTRTLDQAPIWKDCLLPSEFGFIASIRVSIELFNMAVTEIRRCYKTDHRALWGRQIEKVGASLSEKCDFYLQHLSSEIGKEAKLFSKINDLPSNGWPGEREFTIVK